MPAQILDGKQIAQRVCEEVRARAQAFEQRTGRKASLVLVLAGDDAYSEKLVAGKARSAGELGMRGSVVHLPGAPSPAAVLAKVDELNGDPDVDGILVQLPLPAGHHPGEVMRRIDPRKDVDGLHPVNLGLLASGGDGMRPCTPLGCMRMLAETAQSLREKRALVIGRANLVGRPLALLLLREPCTVTVAHSQTQNLEELVRASDVVIAAAGVPELVRGAWIKPGAIVLDVGLNRVGEKKLVGDVEFGPAAERAAFITPVPGGVGPMTVAMLMQNTIEAAERRDP